MPEEVAAALLDDAEEAEPGEAKVVADFHTVVLVLAASAAMLLATAVGAGTEATFGPRLARYVNAVFVMPPVLMITLSVGVQLAKFRGSFIGVQPNLGRLAWWSAFATATFAAVYQLS